MKIRACVCCGAATGSDWRDQLAGPVLVSLSVVIFRRIGRQRQLKSARALHICAACLENAIQTRGESPTALTASEALYGRIAERYNAMKGGH